jgi:hypothetical protein
MKTRGLYDCHKIQINLKHHFQTFKLQKQIELHE